MLKMIGVKLEKIFDIHMYILIEKGLRRGISCIARRYSEANNKYLKDYDPTKPSKCISYLSMNDLYGWAMSEIKLLKNVDNFDVARIIQLDISLKLILNILMNYMYYTMITH